MTALGKTEEPSLCLTAPLSWLRWGRQKNCPFVFHGEESLWYGGDKSPCTDALAVPPLGMTRGRKH